MQTVNIHEAKTQFSKLIEAVSRGEEIIIAKSGAPVARLVPIKKPRIRLGAMEGQFTIPDDFDAPLPDALSDAFYNGPIFPGVEQA